jgi:hypothetical protein
MSDYLAPTHFREVELWFWHCTKCAWSSEPRRESEMTAFDCCPDCLAPVEYALDYFEEY